MNKVDREYCYLLKEILDYGRYKQSRAGETISLFGKSMRFNLQEGLPLLTTKRVHLKSIIHELLWFVKGDTNIKYLVDNDVRIWNEWPYEKFKKSEEYNNETLEEFVLKIREDNAFADKYGDLGPVYGHEWRHFDGPNDIFREEFHLI